MAGLTDKSIFIREEHAGGVRFRILETIREYGQARLRESETEPALKQRHRDWYVRLVEQASAEWFGPQQERWSTRLLLEHANLRAALEFCLAQPDQVRIGLHLAGIPWFLWVACGFLTEGRYWLDRALSLDNDPSPERAWALGTDGYIAVLQGISRLAARFSSNAGPWRWNSTIRRPLPTRPTCSGCTRCSKMTSSARSSCFSRD